MEVTNVLIWMGVIFLTFLALMFIVDFFECWYQYGLFALFTDFKGFVKCNLNMETIYNKVLHSLALTVGIVVAIYLFSMFRKVLKPEPVAMAGGGGIGAGGIGAPEF